MQTCKEIGNQLVSLCQQGKNEEAISQLYGDQIVSVESVQGPGFPREVAGKQNVIEKNQWWSENHEVHSASVKGPFPHGDNKFATVFEYDVTNKPSGQRMQMEEVAVFEVQDGKITREEFFYSM